MNIDSIWAAKKYDKIVQRMGDNGGAQKEIRDKWVSEYEKAINTGALTRPTMSIRDEGAILYQELVTSGIRKQRKSAVIKEMEYLVAALNDETILGIGDPRLDQAIMLGVNDGRDKTMRLWTADDWLRAANSRFENAAKVTAAAAQFSILANEIADAIKDRKVRNTGDLFKP